MGRKGAITINICKCKDLNEALYICFRQEGKEYTVERNFAVSLEDLSYLDNFTHQTTFLSPGPRGLDNLY
eukprot:m.5833 g.5833  ORF g.5833 m.5833 type:complete len:70 (+) comp14225_c0_seq1:200-409(+)